MTARIKAPVGLLCELISVARFSNEYDKVKYSRCYIGEPTLSSLENFY